MITMSPFGIHKSNLVSFRILALSSVFLKFGIALASDAPLVVPSASQELQATITAQLEREKKTYNIVGVDLQDVLRASLTPLQYGYVLDYAAANTKVTLNVKDITVNELLNAVTYTSQLRYFIAFDGTFYFHRKETDVINDYFCNTNLGFTYADPNLAQETLGVLASRKEVTLDLAGVGLTEILDNLANTAPPNTVLSQELSSATINQINIPNTNQLGLLYAALAPIGAGLGVSAGGTIYAGKCLPSYSDR